MLSTIISRCTLMGLETERAVVNNSRQFGTGKLFGNIKQIYDHYFGKNPEKPPYEHICQIGDPVLRNPASPVKPEDIPTKEFQKALRHLYKVMRRYKTIGLSMPQIGLPWEVFVIELTKEELPEFPPEMRKTREIDVIPRMTFINPKMKVVDYTTHYFPEGCGSICGYCADVKRYKAVEITALNSSGENFTYSAKGWTARVIQHEMDHLKGCFYTDVMDSRTFHFTAWDRVNRFGGKIELRFR